MLAGTGHAGKGLFMQQTNQIMLSGHLFHNGHDQLIIIAGSIGICVDGGHLVLARRTLIVFGLAENTQPPKLFIQIPHKCGNTGADGAKIMVIQFLTLGGLCAKQSSACEPKILSLGIHILGKEEIFLLCTYGSHHTLGLLVAEQPQNAQRLPGNLVHRTKQRRFLIQRITGIREKAGRNVQTSIPYKSGRGGVPGSIASGLKCGAKAAIGEGRTIRFATNQFLAAKFHNDSTITGRRNKGIVFFRSDSGHRLEPMGIVGRTFFDCPHLHGLCDLICHIQRQLRAGGNAMFPRSIGILRQALLHGGLVEHIAAKNFRNIQDFFHVTRFLSKGRIVDPINTISIYKIYGNV